MTILEKRPGHLKVKDIPLSHYGDGIGYVADLEIDFSAETMSLRWHEDWNNEASRDTIRVHLSEGWLSHGHYCENNFTVRRETISDIKATRQTLEYIAGHLEECPEVKQTIEDFACRIYAQRGELHVR